MSFRLQRRLFLLGLILASAGIGGDLASPQPPDRVRPGHVDVASAISNAVYTLRAVPGGFELAHPLHRVRFGVDQVEFRGRRPGGPSWSFRLEEMRFAGNGPVLAPLRRAEPTSASGVVTYDRGPLLEEYRLGPQSIEQRFRLLARPPGDGDLDLRGEIVSNGRFEARRTGGWRWSDERGAIDYGTARAYDGNGRPLPLSTRVDARSVTFRLAASVLASAAFPVLIDPVIGADDFRISFMGPNGDTAYGAFRPAIAFNGVDTFLVVWSGDDDTPPQVEGALEIFGRRVSATTGEPIGGTFFISETGPIGDAARDAETPAVAFNSAEAEYFIVWSGDESADNEYEIWGGRVTGSGILLENDIRISDMGPDGNAAYDAVSPAIAYDPVTNEYLVAWSGDDDTGALVEDELDIYIQRLDSNGDPVGTNDLRISSMGPDGDPAYDALSPGVAYNSVDDEYLVVWSGDDDTGSLVENEHEIYAQRITSGGAQTGVNDRRISAMGGTGDPAFDALTPSVAFDRRRDRYLVVWSGDDDLGGRPDDKFEIFGSLLAADGSEIVSDQRLTSTGGDFDPATDADSPSVAYAPGADLYFLVYQADEDFGSGVDNEFEVWSRRVSPESGVAGVSTELRLSSMGPDGDVSFRADEPALACAPQGGACLAVWSGDDDTLPLVDGEFEIFGQRFADSILFVDDFETGGTEEWSAVSP